MKLKEGKCYMTYCCEIEMIQTPYQLHVHVMGDRVKLTLLI